MAKRFMVTGALPYANGHLHVGHIAGAYLPADIFVRYHRAKGDDVLFVCGSDDNGVPITLTARKENKTPAQVVAFYNAEQKKAFEGLGISFDVYGGTHSPEDYERHTQISQHFFKTALEKGYLTKKTSQQFYDPEAKMFLPDRYIKGTCHHCRAPGALGDQCENCGKTTDAMLLIDPVSVISGSKPEVRETTHWFFELDKFREPLTKWLESKENWRYVMVNFTKGLLSEPLPSRSITRDLDWGVPLPLSDEEAKGKVLYVWFDAPIGYVSFTARLCEQKFGDWKKYEDYWKDPNCEILHFIGEDNTIFHTIIWPAMLMAEGTFQLPSYVVSNCFLNFQFPGKDVEKMSKSRGTAVWINDYLDGFDPDPLRFYLTVIAPETQRTAFSFDDFMRRNNEELVAALGNFFHRTLTFTQKYFEGKVPEAQSLAQVDQEQLAMIAGLPAKIGGLIESHNFKAALEELMVAARASNKYFDTKAPWSSRKTNMADCSVTMNVCIQTIKTLTVLMEPFMPFSAEKAAKILNLPSSERLWDKAAESLPAGHPIAEPTVLFKKFEMDELKTQE
ncbi:MAG: methionine--tRNA ligase [Phycisphaerae bacterium]|nr:methionine--tRNA ligase [Phycisphaerae bacterium]